jgi:phage/plasmid-like protein (TIGR03299 family)
MNTRFYSKQFAPWANTGKSIVEAPDSTEALKRAGLDWKVNRLALTAEGNLPVPNFFANVRSDDNAILGIVGNRYKIVQNEEAFAFTDNLIHNEMGVKVTYDSAGSFGNGKRVWMMAKLPTISIMNDDIIPYVVIVNSHDGKGSVRVSVIPMRIACYNALALALSKATRSWSTTHAGDLAAKLEDASNTLDLATAYMTALEEEAELLQQTRISDKLFEEFLEEMFPFNPFATNDKKNNNNLESRQLIRDIYSQKEDLKMFRGTAWGVYNAFADYTSHLEPLRKVSNVSLFRERRFAGFIDGTNELAAIENLIRKTA